MPSRTKTGLNLADRNSYVRVEENINDNLLKIDDDVDATWGGLYGGYIQDETITKEKGKRYIDEFNKKAYICIKPSNVNTEDAYTECNVVSNLDKLQNLTKQSKVLLSYAFHPTGTKCTIPSDMRYISIYYARTTTGETISDSTMIPINSLKIMRHAISKNLYNEAAGARSAIDIEITTDLVLTIMNSNYGVLVVGHY